METNGDILDTSKLTFEGDFDQQVHEIMQHVRLTRREVENLQRLLDDLYDAFRRIWPGCKVYGFGSIVTGLGIKTSDIDCFVQLPAWHAPRDADLVMKARNILRKRHRVFQKLFAITTAKIPIVKFYHVPTNRSCDVNFTSPAGVHNSQLIGYFLEVDQKVLFLTVLIKYWAKINRLTGVNLMPNYCLTLLVMFYLQQRNILPSVKKLQENIDEYFIDGWNSAFNKLDHVTSIDDTLYQLLGGFFNYYNSFKYNKHVINLYLGRPVEKECFLKVENIPEEFSIYKTNLEKDSECKPLRLDTFMCVQDPFEHNRNCAVAVHPRLGQNIVSHFRTACYIYETVDEGSFLKKLLTKTVDIKPPAKRPAKKPVTHNKVKKQYQQNQNLRQNVKLITQNYFKAMNSSLK